jgi:NADPH2 dehydrogenase
MSTKSRLFQPMQIGKSKLQHRMVMSPMTRFRADDEHVPLSFVAEYYSQRGSVPGTFIITEGTFIHPQAGGMAYVPGIYNKSQIEAWLEVTDAVHLKGSVIYCQLWALGRCADEDIAESEGINILSPTTIPVDSEGAKPKAMDSSDIERFVEYYAQAAKNAIEAGFDGVELHGANGFLIDQFIQDVSNDRKDKYGGGIENRSRFALEAVKAVANAIGAHRTGIRLSPWSTFQNMKMANPIPQFSHLIKNLKEMNLAYLHLVESRVAGHLDATGTESLDFALRIWGAERPILIAGGFKPDSAKQLVDDDYANYNIAVVFGRYFISTPDLPFRIEHGLQLEDYNRRRFYKVKSREGYIDYPFSSEFLAANE